MATNIHFNEYCIETSRGSELKSGVAQLRKDPPQKSLENLNDAENVDYAQNDGADDVDIMPMAVGIPRVVIFLVILTAAYVHSAPSRGSAAKHLLERLTNVNRCRYQTEECHPYKDTCCGEMQCLNLIRGHCIYGLETCICLPARLHDNRYRTGNYR
ncbi:hypothetical protein CAPTEDRAFT_186183 [Capitella teleta]|uniref:Uncharacterized protein n=1 Tax=Capitella teleta TaxID=283909 RepID=R7UCA6_CAPTE|nr:hypothetical protein CAPTEDRAFT_186183 [Capitella teleta]|eukprot:ELU03629.1 hypothetical protein CAPTEDRAFT_186183 [Capitella teleta]